MAYSAPRLVSTIARSVTGPAARTSLTTRLSTAGEEAIAISASASATEGRTSIQRSVKYTAA
jgi:hypothetical protein